MSNSQKFNFKDSLNNSTKKENEISISNTNIENKNQESNEEISVKKFRLGKKQEDKSVRKSFPLYVDGEKQKNLDKICKKTGYSRNELINIMIDFCLENLEYEE